MTKFLVDSAGEDIEEMDDEEMVDTPPVTSSDTLVKKVCTSPYCIIRIVSHWISSMTLYVYILQLKYIRDTIISRMNVVCMYI